MTFAFDTVLVLVGLTCAISMYAWSNPGLMERWIMSPYIVARRGQYYRFLTSGFLHADLMHLAFNMLTFFSLSRPVRYAFATSFGRTGGVLAFLALYLGGIILSDIPTYFKHRDDPNYRSLGASGGVSSVLFASILFEPMTRLIMFPLPVAIPGFLWGGLYLAYSWYQSRRMGDNINHSAHLYGALYGVLFTLITLPQSAVIFWNEVKTFGL